MNQSVTATNYWSAQLDELFLTSGGSCDGLATVTATGHLLRHGRNTLLADDRRSKALRLFMDRFRSLPVLILVIALVLRAWLDALIVPAVVFITAVLSFIQAFHAIHAAQCYANRFRPKPRCRAAATTC